MSTATLPMAKASTSGLASVQSQAHGSTSRKDVSFASLNAEMWSTFADRSTYSYEWRVKHLQNLRRLVVERRVEIEEARQKDLGASPMDAFQGEILLTVGELDFALANLAEWMEPQSVTTPMTAQPSSTKIYRQPKGPSLIIAPWNYPFHLLAVPLVSAIAAGCPCVVKPSEVTSHTATLLNDLMAQYMDPKYFKCVLGAIDETTALLKEHWGHIFYTGNGAVGRVVAHAAAEHLASCTLELGGKSPAYVAADANMPVIARRLIGSKFFNNGQTCVAPDYVLVEAGAKEALLVELKKAAQEFYGADPKSAGMTRVVNVRHFDRIKSLIEESKADALIGGLAQADRDSKYIPPTILLEPPLTSRVMNEEIFGPILPVVSVKDISSAIKIINGKENSLASYIFTTDEAKKEQFVKMTHSGGTCINDCIFHITTPYAPFGGAGASGQGSYHGVFGFNEFSFQRTVMDRGTWFELPGRFPPYKADDVEFIAKLLTGTLITEQTKTAIKVAAVAVLGGIVYRARM